MEHKDAFFLKEALQIPRTLLRDILITSLFLNLLAVALPLFTRVVYDKVIPNFAIETLWVLFSGMAMVLVFDSLFKASRNYIIQHISSKTLQELEQPFMTHLLKIPAQHNLAKTNYHLNSLQEICRYRFQLLIPATVDIPFVLVFLLIIYLICPPMALVPLGVGLSLIALQIAFHHKLNKALVHSQEATEERLQTVADLLQGRQTIRQLAHYTPFINDWKTASSRAAINNSRMTFLYQMVMSLSQSCLLFNTVLLMMVGVYQVQASTLSIGGLLAISLLSARILTPLMSIGELLAKRPKILMELKHINQVMQIPDEGTGAAIAFAPKLTLTNATVDPILKNCNFSLQAKEKLAIVGSSGAGKTTLLQILSKERTLSSGSVLWDDRKDIAPAHLRQQMGIVEQHPYFFGRSVRDNLCLEHQYADAELFKTLDLVGLTTFIKATGHGLDLMLDNGGHNLSGGQRQCLALARALLRQPDILLMDEPTSMMDHQMELQLVQNLRFALKNKTVVLVTHRTPLLSLVDKILVLENGQVQQFGDKNTILNQQAKHG